ncbi:hypothetical protein GBF38_017509 [Nibea albiflora]|uniref:Uncharacterized protein n=1 Tax=Nibea albiflora TaxID=240163 RepID=A0ACB7FIM1_NIBAL|nr:hypothetical protein GBF38_017509 [Nibea albiflora]
MLNTRTTVNEDSVDAPNISYIRAGVKNDTANFSGGKKSVIFSVGVETLLGSPPLQWKCWASQSYNISWSATIQIELYNSNS